MQTHTHSFTLFFASSNEHFLLRRFDGDPLLERVMFLLLLLSPQVHSTWSFVFGAAGAAGAVVVAAVDVVAADVFASMSKKIPLP